MKIKNEKIINEIIKFLSKKGLEAFNDEFGEFRLNMYDSFAPSCSAISHPKFGCFPVFIKYSGWKRNNERNQGTKRLYEAILLAEEKDRERSFRRLIALNE